MVIPGNNFNSSASTFWVPIPPKLDVVFYNVYMYELNCLLDHSDDIERRDLYDRYNLSYILGRYEFYDSLGQIIAGCISTSVKKDKCFLLFSNSLSIPFNNAEHNRG